jgi:hypothetical protein
MENLLMFLPLLGLLRPAGLRSKILIRFKNNHPSLSKGGFLLTKWISLVKIPLYDN